MSTSGSLKANSMESMHARENIELLTEQCLEAFFAFMTGVNFNASIFNHPKFIFQLLSISGITIHELLKPAYFS